MFNLEISIPSASTCCFLYPPDKSIQYKKYVQKLELNLAYDVL